MSVRERMKSIWLTITGKGKDLILQSLRQEPEKMDKVVSFLAILELVRDNKINVEQDRNLTRSRSRRRGLRIMEDEF